MLQEGQGAWRAFFTYAGRGHEVQAFGEGAREDIAQLVWRTLRGLLGEPVDVGNATGPDDALVRDIVAARAAGQHEAADEFERKLIALRVGAPAMPRPPRARDMPPTGPGPRGGYLNPSRKVY
jgi:hypothetical protein